FQSSRSTPQPGLRQTESPHRPLYGGHLCGSAGGTSIACGPRVDRVGRGAFLGLVLLSCRAKRDSLYSFSTSTPQNLNTSTLPYLNSSILLPTLTRLLEPLKNRSKTRLRTVHSWPKPPAS